MMTDSAMRRAVSRFGFATAAIPKGSDGRFGLQFPGGRFATTRVRGADRIRTGPPARLDCGISVRSPERRCPRVTRGIGGLCPRRATTAKAIRTCAANVRWPSLRVLPRNAPEVATKTYNWAFPPHRRSFRIGCGEKSAETETPPVGPGVFPERSQSRKCPGSSDCFAAYAAGVLAAISSWNWRAGSSTPRRFEASTTASSLPSLRSLCTTAAS